MLYYVKLTALSIKTISRSLTLFVVKFYFMHISKNKLFFLLIDAFFDADSKSEIRIFRTALVFEL